MDVTKHNNDGISFEKYYPVYNDQENGVTLRPHGQIAEFAFFFERKELAIGYPQRETQTAQQDDASQRNGLFLR